MSNFIWLLLISYGIYYFFKNRKKLTPEEKEALRLAEIEREKAEEQRREEVRKERLAYIENIENLSERLYFSYSFVSETSPLFLIDGNDNSVIKESQTTLRDLYSSGFYVFQADKTGQSAQMEDFNFLIHVKRLSGSR